MVTSFPYYPEWRKRRVDRGVAFRTDTQQGVCIHRCWHYVPAKVGLLKRILHEASFVTVSFLCILTLRRPDLFVVVSPPLLLGVAAWLASVMKRAPFVFHVQDLQPDAAVGLGMLGGNWFTRILYRIERFAYAKAARVSGISRGMLEMFRMKGVPERKLVYFPNGVKLPLDLPDRGGFRGQHKISEGTFLAVYSGNLGVKQGLEVLIDAAALLKSGLAGGPAAFSHPVKIVIAGEGARRAHLAELVARAKLDNLLLLPLLPDEAYRQMLADADCTVITQQAGTGSFFFPSKLLTALAAGKPVVTVADETSELAKASAVGGFGFNVPPNDAAALAGAIRCLADAAERAQNTVTTTQRVGNRLTEGGDNDPHLMQPSANSCHNASSLASAMLSPGFRVSVVEMGRAGLEFAEQFEERQVLARFEEELQQLAAEVVCEQPGSRESSASR
jgi:colanic acid biosynthesis glycosyl transferase WcaI